MSYILEALKKAQAERQLGSAPTIHALPIHLPAARGSGARRNLLWIGLAGVAIFVLGGWWWVVPMRLPPARPMAVPTPLAGAPVVAAPIAAPPIAAQPVATQPASGMSAPPAARQSPITPPATPPVVAARPAPIAPLPALAQPPVSPPLPKPQPVKAVAAAPAPARPSDEAPVPALRELPEAVQRSVPTVTFGGYMYSANPADRLLLVDKVLRHEGEEVAPGLVLEKLLPKEAVMNYRGSRYRMAY